ncbi:MAG: DUF5706 domain-containing protein [Cytophagales bacterium]
MTQINGSIIQKAAEYAHSYLKKNLSKDLTFHNVQHTLDVVAAAEEICKQVDVSEEEKEIVMLSAWFHDTGYAIAYKGHENESVKIAKDFLETQNYPKNKLDKVIACILSTDYEVAPENKIERILNDADLYHLSTDKFFEKSDRLREEFRHCKIKDEFSDREWMEMNLYFISKHNYQTDYGKEKLEKARQANQKRLKKKLKAMESTDNTFADLEKKNKKLLKQLKKYQKKAEQKPDRGIETMFRTTSKNHLELSAIADNKANIMISINAIIISILMSVMIRKFEDYPNLIIPTILLVTVSLLTIVFAVLATRPNITKGTFTREDILQKRTNLLFFGNFFNSSLKEYEWGINQLMLNSDLLYGSMTKDIFFLGKVLGRKYKLLRTAYNIFMYGLVISVLAYGAAMMFFPVYH